MGTVFIGMDIGTTGVRAAIFTAEGKGRGYRYQEYPLMSDTAGKAELDPETIWESFLDVMKEAARQCKINGDRIEGIGISSQMHSMVAVDRHGNPLTNIITWADNRPAQETGRIAEQFNCGAFYQKTGCRIHHPAYYPAKILWLKRAEPDIAAKVFKYLTIKEYILYKLYDEFVIDMTDASATACYNLKTFRWDNEILRDVIGIQESQLGNVVDCTHVMTGMKKEIASQIGIDPSVPMVIGSGDGIMANLGCGGIDSTTMSCTIGTSGALRIAVDKPLLDEQMRTWCYCFTKNKWVAGGAVNDGGIALKWFRDQLKGPYEQDFDAYHVKNVYQLFDAYVQEIEIGSDGLFFLPFLTGERSPGWHPNASASVYGLKYAHDKRHFIRSAMEGVLYNMYSIFEVLSGIDSHVERIIANGGYVNSKVWLQMQADIFNREIFISQNSEAAAWGAAFTAMVAVGAADGFESIKQETDDRCRIIPDEANHQTYRKLYRKFRELYGTLIDVQ